MVCAYIALDRAPDHGLDRGLASGALFHARTRGRRRSIVEPVLHHPCARHGVGRGIGLRRSVFQLVAHSITTAPPDTPQTA